MLRRFAALTWVFASGLALACNPAMTGESDTNETDDSTTTSGETGEATGETSETTAGPGSETDTDGETDTSGTDGAVGCDGAPLLTNPSDPAADGPWPVGVRTVQVDGLNVEVWYPASVGSEAGAEPRVYDIRTKLPDSEQGKVPDADNPWQPCNCYPDLPLDDTHGPYPAVLFVHGTAGFASQSLEFMTHWASRGFVVMSADHPGLMLGDLLGSLCGQMAPPQDLSGDLAKMLQALDTAAGDLAFLKDHVDTSRVGMAGHSAGGNAVSGQGDRAQVLIPMGAGGTSEGAMLQSTLVLGAQEDAVVAYGSQTGGYDSSPAPKRLVGLANAGHLAFSSLCSLENTSGQDFLEIATAYDICGAQFAGFLFDCKDSYIPDPTSWEITQFASSSVLEETLHCHPEAGGWLGQIQATYPEVADFFEEL